MSSGGEGIAPFESPYAAPDEYMSPSQIQGMQYMANATLDASGVPTVTQISAANGFESPYATIACEGATS